MSESRVDWYGKDVLMLIENANADILDEVAAEVLGQSKINIQANDQIDTGFMLNSGYMVSANSNTYAQAKGSAWSQAERTMVSPLKPQEDGGSLVAYGAEYAIYQEIRNSFLYKALNQSANKVSGIIKQIGKRKIK